MTVKVTTKIFPFPMPSAFQDFSLVYLFSSCTSMFHWKRRKKRRDMGLEASQLNENKKTIKQAIHSCFSIYFSMSNSDDTGVNYIGL